MGLSTPRGVCHGRIKAKVCCGSFLCHYMPVFHIYGMWRDTRAGCIRERWKSCSARQAHLLVRISTLAL